MISTLADYAVARSLLLPAFRATGHGKVPEYIVATIKALKTCIEEPEIIDVSAANVAFELGIHRDTARRRLEKCQELGYAFKQNPGQGRRPGWVLGDYLQREDDVLPEAQAVKDAWLAARQAA